MAPILTRLGQSFGFGASTAGGAPVSTPITATGGNSVFTYNNKKVHKFTSSGDFVVTAGNA